MRCAKCFSVLMLLILFFSSHEPTSVLTPAFSSCIELTLAHRTRRENCWAAFRLDPRKQICIEHAVWLEWLKSTHPGPFCPDPARKWKVYSPLQNGRQNARNQGPPKKVQLSLNYRPQPPRQSRWGNSAFILKTWQKIERIRERTSTLLGESDPLGILRSLILNEGSGTQPLPFFRKLGFVHLVTPSGIHLYAWRSTWTWMIRVLCRYGRFPVLPGLWFNRITSFLGCSALWILNGARMGMLRPWILLLLREASQLLGFRWKKGSPLFFALWVDFLVGLYRVNVESPGTSGRWIYALAVGGGLYFHSCFRSIHLGLALGSWVGVALWEAWNTGMIALATPLISLITLPCLCVFGYPGIILSILLNELGWTSEARSILKLFSSGLTLLISSLSRLAMMEGNLWIIPQRSLGLGALISTLWVGLTRTKNSLWTSALLILMLILGRQTELYSEFINLNRSPNPSPNVDQAQLIEQLDVGQGDGAIVIGRKIGMIDTGSLHSITDLAWLEIFGERSIQKIDWIALSHLDEDHSGGVLRLARLIPLGCIVTPAAELQTPRGQVLAKQLARIGLSLKSWESPCIPFPHFSYSNPKQSQPNGNMGVILVPLQSGGAYLAAGDATGDAEILIGKWASSWISPTTHPLVLKVSHHGSKTSSSKPFLNAIHPTEAWISVGAGNRYGLPSAAILNQFKSLRIRMRRTDRDGSLTAR